MSLIEWSIAIIAACQVLNLLVQNCYLSSIQHTLYNWSIQHYNQSDKIIHLNEERNKESAKILRNYYGNEFNRD